MRPQHVMFLGFIFLAGTIISLTFSGQWLGPNDVGVLNALTPLTNVSVFGIWSLAVPNLNFFITGFKALTMFDFAFFSGEMGLLQWFFMFTIGAATVWGIFTIIIITAMGLFKR